MCCHRRGLSHQCQLISDLLDVGLASIYLSIYLSSGGSMARWVAYLLPDPAAPGLITSIPEIFSEEKIANVAEINQQPCLEKSGHWLENTNQTHLVLASSQLVIQKNVCHSRKTSL